MQGYANKKYDLPRPYSLKPKHRKGNVDRLATNYFTTPQRKIIGYVILMILFSVCLLTFIRPEDQSADYELDFTGEHAGNAASNDEMVLRSNMIKKGSQKRPLDEDEGDFDELLEDVQKELKASKSKGSRVDSVKGAVKGSTAKKIGSGSEGDDGLENDAADSLTEDDYVENIDII